MQLALKPNIISQISQKFSAFLMYKGIKSSIWFVWYLFGLLRDDCYVLCLKRITSKHTKLESLDKSKKSLKRVHMLICFFEGRWLIHIIQAGFLLFPLSKRKKIYLKATKDESGKRSWNFDKICFVVEFVEILDTVPFQGS